ncbi:hypothetical protein RDWZM_008000 [Blomia tropicalis]|uniref:Uncharacterized protein n=1 Tax=Blomia tropicalis TaxID=40697 RepID=A0A9Q0LYI0_BLOTA|nr:hypothetical protein BLOT_003670 [Blomia tropicalis]KAJ6216843.1 hypothetical protein RDWZM_008000 [Blomia tropicalis]
MRNSDGIKGVQWVLVGAIIIGIVFMVTGSIITGIAYTEITPPDYDTNYDRYIGSSVTRLIGPFILAFGAFILIGSCGFFGFQSFKRYDPIPPHPVEPTKNQFQE